MHALLIVKSQKFLVLHVVAPLWENVGQQHRDAVAFTSHHCHSGDYLLNFTSSFGKKKRKKHFLYIFLEKMGRSHERCNEARSYRSSHPNPSLYIFLLLARLFPVYSLSERAFGPEGLSVAFPSSYDMAIVTRQRRPYDYGRVRMNSF